nr:Flp pilus assembly protein CpaB [uncultured Rhodopila sp.]
MVFRVVLLIIISLGLLGFGVVAWVSVHPHTAASASIAADVRVFVAAKALHAGSLLKADDIASAVIQAGKLPASAIKDSAVQPGDLNGTMLRRNLAAGDLFLSTDILRPADRGFLAAVLGAGMRAMTVAVDAVSGTAGLIWPGDHVDVLLTQTLDDATRPLGRRVAALTVLGDIRVIAIDQQLVQGAAPGAENTKPAATVTLEVTPVQAERVAVATRMGKLSLVVRSADSQQPKSAEVDVQTVWGSDVAPAMGADPPRTDRRPIRIFQGGADAKEYRF